MRASIALALVFVVAVSATVHSRIVLEEATEEVAGWTVGPRVPADTPFELMIFIKQSNVELLESHLYAVSDPRSPRYGQHFTFEQVNELVAPKDEAVNAVMNWLSDHGINITDSLEFSPSYDMALVRIECSVVESLLGTTYNYYKHDATGHTTVRTPRYTVPSNVAAHIDFIGPTIRLPNVVVHKARPISAPEAEVTPTFLRNLYKVGTAKATNANSSVALCGFLAQYVAPTDLQAFYKKFDPQSSGRTLKYYGPNKQNNPGVEASLDVQFGSSLAWGVPNVWFWSTAGQQPGNPGNEPFLVWLYGLGNTTTVPWIFSMSYGDNENTVVPNYALRVNQEFQKMGLRGITLLASSGDGGVAGSQPTQCKTFIPTFPAASPFVTAVGGTTGSSPEVAGPLSGGGFSNYWAQPSYQTAAITQYFKVAKNLPPSSDYNTTGAGFPDVASQAYNFPIYVGGAMMEVDGTSCASPVFAGIMALLNDIRLNANKSPLGWLNPLFYQNPTAFQDITTGDNPGCGTSGFHAAAGWDPVTGWGSMNYQAWAAIVAKLP